MWCHVLHPMDGMGYPYGVQVSKVRRVRLCEKSPEESTKLFQSEAGLRRPGDSSDLQTGDKEVPACTQVPWKY